MEPLGAKLLRVGRADGYWTDGQIAHWCPACGELHPFAITERNSSNAIWSFDGNAGRPTFAPSMNIRVGPFPDGRIEVCHYFLKAGMLQFLSDCTHAMKGQTVSLPDLPATYRNRTTAMNTNTAPAEAPLAGPMTATDAPLSAVPSTAAPTAPVAETGAPATPPSIDEQLTAIRADLAKLVDLMEAFSDRVLVLEQAASDASKQPDPPLVERERKVGAASIIEKFGTAEIQALDARVTRIEASIRHMV